MLNIYKVTSTILIDISSFVSSIRWSGNREIAPRKVEVNLINPFDLGGHSKLDLDLGDNILVINDDDELFRGKIFKDRTNSNNEHSFVAYDSLYYWANNRDTFIFENVTASEIFTNISNRFEIPMGVVADTVYTIKSQINRGSYLSDVIFKALETTYRQTGLRYYLRSVKGNVELRNRVDLSNVLILESSNNIGSWTRQRSAEGLFNRLKLVANDGNTIVISEDNDLLETFGILQDYRDLSDDFNAAELQIMANELLDKNAKIDTSFVLREVIGANDIISGNIIYLRLPEIELQRAYYVEQDTHEISNSNHLMTLTLREAL